MLSFLFSRVQKTYEKLVDMIFPPAAAEKLSSEQFISKASRAEPHLETITCLFDYKDPLVREAIWALKYRGSRRICRMFAEILYDEIIQEIADDNPIADTLPVLIPVPASKERYREKGFNQVELVAGFLEKMDGTKNFEVRTDILVKNKHTVTQTSIQSRSKRLKNLSGCFSVAKPENISTRTIILIDDVSTTGATLLETRATLLKAGAKQVQCFAIAH